MGLSILIPVYNFNITTLVVSLVNELKKLSADAEIIILDDGSNNNTADNDEVKNLPFVLFYKNNKNEGRIASRCRLANLAKHDYFLFLDCDSTIVKKDFLINYFVLIKANEALASGGRIYSRTKPTDCSLRLHWNYGTKREYKKIAETSIDTIGFMSNNFLIKKEVFNKLDYSIQLKGYGHEDTLWGIQFEQLGIRCKYIDNPVQHDGLETAETFIQKSENALANLLIIKKNVNLSLVIKHVKIFMWYVTLKYIGLANLFFIIEKPFHNYLKKNLVSCKPNLFYFDCYRLATLIKMIKSTSKK